jgi:hypothetical protein
VISPGSASPTSDDPCASGRYRLAATPWHLAVALGGLGALVAGVVVSPGSVPLGPVLISLGAVTLLLGVALPLVSQIEFGVPMLGKVVLSARERRERLRAAVEDFRGLIVACAAGLCPDADAAGRAIEAAVSDALGLWRGTDGEALRRFLLCRLVRQARFEARTKASPSTTAEPFLRLPLTERAVLILEDRAGLDETSVARILGLPVSGIAPIRAHAASVGLLDSPP